MTVKLVVLYTQPNNVKAFDQHYLDVHGPLALAIPGLLRFESALLVGAGDGGEVTYHRMAELYFADQGGLGAALATDEGKATAADFGQIAPSGSRMFVTQVNGWHLPRAGVTI